MTSEQNWDAGWELWIPKGHIFKFIPGESGDYTLTVKSDYSSAGITVKNSKNEDIGYSYPESVDVTVNELKAGELYYIDIYACYSYDLYFTLEFDKPLMSSEPEPGSGSTPLEQVSDVVLSNTGVATWNDISNESNYDLQLYKNETLQGNPVNVDANTNSYDFLSAMRVAGGGTYTVKVTAKGDGSTYSDGLQSEASSAQNVIQLEPVSSGLIWSGDVAHWDLDSNAVSYDVQLYKDESLEGGVVNVLAENAADGLDFAAVIEAAGDGTYTYKVTAKGNDTLILDGAPSDFSNDNIQTTESTIDVTMTAI